MSNLRCLSNMSSLFDCVSPKARRLKRKQKQSSSATGGRGTAPGDKLNNDASDDEGGAYVISNTTADTKSSGSGSKTPEVLRSDASGETVTAAVGSNVVENKGSQASHEQAGASDNAATPAPHTTVNGHTASGAVLARDTQNVNNNVSDVTKSQDRRSFDGASVNGQLCDTVSNGYGNTGSDSPPRVSNDVRTGSERDAVSAVFTTNKVSTVQRNICNEVYIMTSR